jgi:hypothetical protein
MKLFSFIIILFLFEMDKFPLDIFIKDIPSGWSYHKDSNKLIITKDSTIAIQYCDVSPMYHEPINKFSYKIVIDFTKKLTSKEIQRRKFLQDSILSVYTEEYNKKPDKLNYSRKSFFQFKKNTIDTLRVPFYSDKKYSYYIMNNFPLGHCIISDELQEIENINCRLKDK